MEIKYESSIIIDELKLLENKNKHCREKLSILKNEKYIPKDHKRKLSDILKHEIMENLKKSKTLINNLTSKIEYEQKPLYVDDWLK